jgi:hypothetical protein
MHHTMCRLHDHVITSADRGHQHILHASIVSTFNSHFYLSSRPLYNECHRLGALSSASIGANASQLPLPSQETSRLPFQLATCNAKYLYINAPYSKALILWAGTLHIDAHDQARLRSTFRPAAALTNLHVRVQDPLHLGSYIYRPT